MNNLARLSIKNLVITYVLLFAVYTMLPDSLEVVQRVLSPLMLVIIGLVALVSLLRLNQN